MTFLTTSVTSKSGRSGTTALLNPKWPSIACRYIFPGLAFGAHLAQSGVVTDEMLTSAAEALPKLLKDDDVKAGRVYPSLNDIRCLPT